MAKTVFEEDGAATAQKQIESLEEVAVPEKQVTVGTPPAEVEVVKCDCCRLTEECTTAYISRVREMHQGRWICGLCAEAVKDEVDRSGWKISEEEALERHASFCEEIRSPPTEELISAVKQLLIRSLDSPRSVRSNPGTPRGKDGSDLSRALFGRSQSCFPSMDA